MVETLDDLKPLDRADLICPEIKLLADELIDALGSDMQRLAELVADSVELELGAEEYPDSKLYPRLLAGADRRLSEWIKRRIRSLAEDRINERLLQQFEDTQPGMTAEEEDRLCRARDLVGVRRWKP